VRAAIYWTFLALSILACCYVFWQVKAAQDECTSRGGVLVSSPLSWGVCVDVLKPLSRNEDTTAVRPK